MPVPALRRKVVITDRPLPHVDEERRIIEEAGGYLEVHDAARIICGEVPVNLVNRSPLWFTPEAGTGSPRQAFPPRPIDQMTKWQPL